jgi:hypothetical protein
MVEKAQECGADLIVVGSHGYGFGSARFSAQFQIRSCIMHHV